MYKLTIINLYFLIKITYFNKEIKTTLETINLDPKQIKFLINVKNEIVKGRSVARCSKNQPIIIGAEIKFYNFLKFRPKCV